MFYWCMDQTNVQRVLGARTIADGQRGAIFAGFLKLLVPFILVLPGMIGRVLYPDLPTYDSAYPRLVEGLLPVGLRGLVLAGLVAILMSSMSACYNSSATLVVRDFVLRFRPATSEQQQVVTGRWVTVAVAILGVLAAPLVGMSVTIWYYLQDISAYLSVPMAAAIFLGFLWKRGTTAGAGDGCGGGLWRGTRLLPRSNASLVPGHPRSSLSPLVSPSIFTRLDHYSTGDGGSESGHTAARFGESARQRVPPVA
jgi:SSS family solute:Na+ symporter